MYVLPDYTRYAGKIGKQPKCGQGSLESISWLRTLRTTFYIEGLARNGPRGKKGYRFIRGRKLSGQAGSPIFLRGKSGENKKKKGGNW